MYQHYYTAADVTIAFESKRSGTRLVVDQAVAIAYTHNVSTVPVYTLGDYNPSFFSQGNSLVQGQLDLAFSSTEYLVTGLRALIANGGSDYVIHHPIDKENHQTSVSLKGTQGQARELRNLSKEEFALIVNDIEVDTMRIDSKSIIDIPDLFDIIITYDNTNSNMNGIQSTTVIKDVKLNSQSTAINSVDDTSLVDRISFLAKNIK